MLIFVDMFCFVVVPDMKILQAFPCRSRFADKENAAKVEEEVSYESIPKVILPLPLGRSHVNPQGGGRGTLGLAHK